MKVFELSRFNHITVYNYIIKEMLQTIYFYKERYNLIYNIYKGEKMFCLPLTNNDVLCTAIIASLRIRLSG